MGGQMVALQDKNGAGAQQVNWVHQDPVTKSQRLTDSAGTVLANKVDLDPWGIETGRSVSPEMQPHQFTSYERDTNKSDEAMMRRYTASRNRFDQPDPFEGSYDLTNPQSFNRYSYVKNDPVNFVDPSGLVDSWNCAAEYNLFGTCTVSGPPDEAEGGFTGLRDPDLIGGGGGGGDGDTGGTTQQNPPAQQPPCTFNINITGASGQILTDLQNELTRIFQSGGQNVVFGQPGQANGGSMNLNVVTQYSGEAANMITQQGASSSNPGIFGATVPETNNAYVNQTNIFNAGGYGRTVSLGTRIGRVGGHEVIQHGFLKTPQEGNTVPSDITFGRYPALSVRSQSSSGLFTINASTAAALNRLC